MFREFARAADQAAAGLASTPYVRIEAGRLHAKWMAREEEPEQAHLLRQLVEAGLARVRTEALLAEIDARCRFTEPLMPRSGRQAPSAKRSDRSGDHRGDYTALLATLVAHGTHLGLRAMADSAEEHPPAGGSSGEGSQKLGLDVLLRISKTCLREETLTQLGRLAGTTYLLGCVSSEALRRQVRRQLNRGEERHRLARYVFFAEQGELRKGDYERIMNQASCLSLLSNAILVWNTLRIGEVVAQAEADGKRFEPEVVARILPLMHRHVPVNFGVRRPRGGGPGRRPGPAGSNHACIASADCVEVVISGLSSRRTLRLRSGRAP